MRVLIRVGYGLAPILVFGAVAMSTGGGHHRIVVLALGVLIALVLGATADGPRGVDGASLKGRFVPRSRTSADDREAPAAEK